MFVESKIDFGTTFKIYFPQTDEQVQVTSLVTPQIKDLKGEETILVAEDEDELRIIVCAALKRKGYTVLEARDGVEALEHLKTHKNKVHIVLTDALMPRMGGRELHEKAKGLDLKSKFLFLSGYTEDVLIQQGINSGEAHFLEKPFSIKTLLNKVRSVLKEEK